MLAGNEKAAAVFGNTDTRDWAVHRERTGKVSKDTWCHRPEPFPDESLSSYLTRAAKDNVAEPLKVIHALNPRMNQANLDLDRSLNADLLHQIARHLERGDFELQDMCMPVKSSNGLILDGARYCPICLNEDGKAPYFRYAWRLNFITICNLHGCYLEDKCPQCGASVRYWETKFDQNITTCYNCGESILDPGNQSRVIESDYKNLPLYHTFQDELLEIFMTEKWNGKTINRVVFFNRFWKLAWGLHWLESSGNVGLAEPKESWKAFRKEVASCSVDAFKVLYPAIKLLGECPERLMSPFKCPKDGTSFSRVTHYVRHVSVHDVFNQMKILQPISKINYLKCQKSLPMQLLSLIQRLCIPQAYQSAVLADAADFLTGAPTDFLQQVTSSKRPHLLIIGLALTFGRFYGIFPREIAFLLCTSPQAVINARRAFQNIAHRFRLNLPDTALPTWTNRIFSEVHERFRTLSSAELAELVKAAWVLVFPWRQGYFLEHIATFAEAMYAYWAESLGHRIPLKCGKPFENPTLARLIRQLSKGLPYVNTGQIQISVRILGKRGFFLTPFVEFQSFLHASYPQWRTYSYSKLVAVIFMFVRKKYPASSLRRFSLSLGMNPRELLSSIPKINKVAMGKNRLLSCPS